MEIMLAVFMLGSLLTANILLQTTAFSGIVQFSARMERIILLKNKIQQVFFERAQKKEPSKETIIKEPETTIRYSTKRPPKESSLKEFKNIMIENITAQWDSRSAKEEETLISFLFKPEKQKS